MDDLISRQEALDCFHAWIDKHGDIHEPDEMAEYNAIEALPSAQPDVPDIYVGDMIYRQAAIDLFPNDSLEWDTKGGYVAPHLARRMIKELPSAQPEPKWIPCSERLPEESGRYLISVLDGVGRRTTVAPYQPRHKAWTMTGRMTYWKVIAWMPLPEPYRGEGEE